MWKRDESDALATSSQKQPPPAPVSRDAADKLVMNLGKSVMIKGELSGSEDLTLYGRMEGSVKLTDHTLTIGPEADIRAEITAKTIVIMGGVTGNVFAGEKVEIRSSGSVTGDIASPRLAIQDGGCMRGKVATTTRAHAPATTAAPAKNQE
jgi:cytoskeletal protein CcmA (bactofilin family)